MLRLKLQFLRACYCTFVLPFSTTRLQDQGNKEKRDFEVIYSKKCSPGVLSVADTSEPTFHTQPVYGAKRSAPSVKTIVAKCSASAATLNPRGHCI